MVDLLVHSRLKPTKFLVYLDVFWVRVALLGIVLVTIDPVVN